MIIQYNTKKVELCFVKVPEDTCNFVVRRNTEQADLWFDLKANIFFSNWVNLPPGNWQIVGNPFELSEEQCNDSVDIVWNGHNEQVFKDYVNDNWEPNARSSFGGLLHALNIYQTNPFGAKRDLYKIPAAGSPSWLKSVKDWQDAEERTGSWILLMKV